jgi:hypothetical protein
VKVQLRIGIMMFPRGFISLDWVDLLNEFSIPFPDRKMTGFLRLLWLDFVEPVWAARNEMAHQRLNLNALVETQSLCDRLYWYLENPHVLSLPDRQSLLTYTREEVPLMTAFVQATRIRELDTVRSLFVTESQQRDPGQSSLLRFFHPVRGVG